MPAALTVVAVIITASVADDGPVPAFDGGAYRAVATFPADLAGSGEAGDRRTPPRYGVAGAVAHEPARPVRRAPAVLPVQFTLVDDGGSPASTAAPRPDQPIKLRQPGSQPVGERSSPQIPTTTGSVTTVAASLAIVLGLFFGLVWLSRKNMPRGMTALSADVIQVLGRAPLGGRQQMQLVRIGSKLLLVAITPTGAETLTEITDPQDVDHIVALCAQHRPGSVTASFRSMLQELGNQPPGRGVQDAPLAGAPGIPPAPSTTEMPETWEVRHGA